MISVGHIVEAFGGVSQFVTAMATVAVAAFTGTLWWSIRGMLRSYNETIRLAREDFISTHRPKLRVRNIVVNPLRTDDWQELPPLSPGHPIEGQFVIANVGGSRADILSGHCMVFWSREGLPMRRPYEGGVDNLQAMNRTLLSGQSTTVVFKSADADVVQTAGGNIPYGFRLYVMGWVSYADRNNNERRTSFCREFRQLPLSLPRFFALDDPDYEHEE